VGGSLGIATEIKTVNNLILRNQYLPRGPWLGYLCYLKQKALNK